MENSKIVEIRICGLFGHLNHQIPLNDLGVTFIHGPNGCGKTTVLRLLYAIFDWDTSSLFEINYSKIEIEMNDRSIFSVVRFLKKNEDSDQSTPELHFSLSSIADESFILLSSRNYGETRVPPSEIEEFFPFLSRVGPREWIDHNSGNKINYAEVLVEYGDRSPHFSRKKRPDWLVSYIESINIHFVKTQRLLNFDYTEIRRIRSDRQSVTDVIQIYSDEIKELISRKLAEQAAVSQLHDRSFPERLLSMATDESVSEESIRQRYLETEAKIEGLVGAGLIDQQKSIALPSKKFEETEKKVLSLYLIDVNKKLSVFDELQKKIQVFLEIIAGKLKTKLFSVNRTEGFYIESSHRKGERLFPSQLSSGEQHQIVLFYELIFKSEKNSFFLVDEPEISLHIDWQRSFLNDIHKISGLGDRSFLIATHSPQIIGSHRELAIALEEGIFEGE